jgi:hypothetical protein
MLSQGLGMIECLVLTISVGLMLDPLTHVAFAYAEADGSREQRLAAALGSVGISILAGGVSTAGSCALLLLTTIVLFARFALLFCSLMLLTLVYALAFLAPLLLLLGPAGYAPDEAPRRAAWWQRRWRRPQRGLTAADAAAIELDVRVSSEECVRGAAVL